MTWKIIDVVKSWNKKKIGVRCAGSEHAADFAARLATAILRVGGEKRRKKHARNRVCLRFANGVFLGKTGVGLDPWTTGRKNARASLVGRAPTTNPPPSFSWRPPASFSCRWAAACCRWEAAWNYLCGPYWPGRPMRGRGQSWPQLPTFFWQIWHTSRFCFKFDILVHFCTSPYFSAVKTRNSDNIFHQD